MIKRLFIVLLSFCYCYSHDGSNKGHIHLSSDEYTELHYSYGWKVAHYKQKNEWIFFLERSEDSTIDVVHWKSDGSDIIIGNLGPREGVISVRAYDVNSEGLLAFKGLLSPTIYTMDLKSSKPTFKASGSSATTWSQLFFFNNKTIVSSDTKFDLVDMTNTGLKRIKQISEIVPEHHQNPLVRKSNLYTFIFGNSFAKIAIGYSMHNEIFVFDKQINSRKFQTIPIYFPGLTFPDEKEKLKRNVENPVMEYFRRFHYLHTLSWHKNELYGLFFKGQEDRGTWVLLGGRSRIVWKNRRENDQVISLSDDEIIMGKEEETEDGLVTWELWRTAQIPKP